MKGDTVVFCGFNRCLTEISCAQGEHKDTAVTRYVRRIAVAHVHGVHLGAWAGNHLSRRAVNIRQTAVTYGHAVGVVKELDGVEVYT